VTCRDVEGLIISYASGAPTPPEAAAHIAGCERCRRLARAMGETREFAPPSREQLEQIEARVFADLKPVKPMLPASVLVFALVFILMIVVVVGVVALGIAGWQALNLLQRSVVFTALTAATGLLARSTSRQIVPGGRLLLSPYRLVIAVLAVMIGIFTMLFHPREESTFVSTGLVCLRIGLECAIPAAFLLWLLLRRGAILNPMLTGATTGALAGLSGLTVLEIFCPNLNAYHILVWHLGAVLTSVVGGMAIGLIAEHSGWTRTSRTS
jgi:hypothetical protein